MMWMMIFTVIVQRARGDSAARFGDSATRFGDSAAHKTPIKPAPELAFLPL